MSSFSSNGSNKKTSLVAVSIWKQICLKDKLCMLAHKNPWKPHLIKSYFSQKVKKPLTMLPTRLLHKARPSSPCFQCLGLSQNSLGTAQDVEVYFSSLLPTISFFFHDVFFWQKRNVCMSLSLHRPDHTQKTLRSLIYTCLESFWNIFGQLGRKVTKIWSLLSSMYVLLRV